ncbi:hypothetical protein [Sorangium sp. So ce1335]|uniref:hypothetical protein n=1 Tax=Sorangium sp. So ce1335 TaxID=3133335 RepID=UPI003F5E21A0
MGEGGGGGPSGEGGSGGAGEGGSGGAGEGGSGGAGEGGSGGAGEGGSGGAGEGGSGGAGEGEGGSAGEGGSGGAGEGGSGGAGEGGSGGAGEGGSGGAGEGSVGLVWAHGYGGPGNERGAAIASDAAGNFYVTGAFEGTVDFGAGPLTSAGGEDIFLLKLDPSGTLLWSKRFGSSSRERGDAVAIDGSGNVLLAGSYSGGLGYPTVDFGGGPLESSDDSAVVFVVKLDAAGNHLWSRGQITTPMWGHLGDIGTDQLAVDALGDVYAVVFNRQEGPSPSLVKLDTAGAVLWNQVIPGEGMYETRGRLALDGAGNVLTTLVSIRGRPSCPCAERFAVSKFTPAGDIAWSRLIGPELAADADTGATALAIAVDAADEVLVTGSTDGTVDFGGGAPPAGPVLVKLDENGEHLFSRSIPFADRIALDLDGSLLVAGGGLARLDATGAAIWTLPIAAPVSGLAVSPLGTIAITGAAPAALDLGAGPIAHAGGSDVFVATFDPEGNPGARHGR